MTKNDNNIIYDQNAQQLNCRGAWDLKHLPALQTFFKDQSFQFSQNLIIDGHEINQMDSAGAWLLCTFAHSLKKQQVSVEFKNFSQEQRALLDLIQQKIDKKRPLAKVTHLSWVASVGQTTIIMLNGFLAYLTFIGQLSYECLRLILRKTTFRWGATSSTIYRNGFQALPIIALLSFMIGIVITFQMGLQLQNYGANIFIVDLLGLSILREFGPLLTAIMVAGRTGSAYTAELGMMKLNQEIDALNTMGVTPGELLLLPRIIGLLIALPLLTMWANMFGIFGGMVMANNMLGISWYDFLHRFPTAIPLRALMIGMGKSPIFALLIASIGCFQGMNVQGSATSVGRNTTRSVVLAIFFIIVADAIFSVIFSKLKL